MSTDPAARRPPYQLSVDGLAPGTFRVHALTGREALSEAWSFDVVVTAADGDEVERVALGQRAVLVLDVEETKRAFYGIVAAVRLAGAHQADRATKYHVRVVPRLWLLKRKKRTRVFQKMRVPDVVTAVLAEAGIGTRWQLVRDYPVREYCTQYEESDYRFVTRLLAEAAIFFYFPEGPALDAAALAAGTALGAAASAGEALAGALAGSAAGGLVASAASLVEPLIPGDTVIGADDAACYPALDRDDAAALAASTAAALAPEASAVAGVTGPVGSVIGGVSAVAGAVVAGVTAAVEDVPTLDYLELQGTTTPPADKVQRFTLRTSVRADTATFRDYDPERPLVPLESTAASSAPFPPSALAVAAAATSAAGGLLPGAAPALAGADAAVNAVGAALGLAAPLEVYEHHGDFLFPKWGFAGDEAPRILRQKRRRAVVAEGESGCPSLCPAHRFALRRHPAERLDRAYVVTRVEHRGQTYPQGDGEWKVYANAFECAPAEVTYVPPRPKRRSVQVALTATVVGPAGEEIHVDALGRIRVQFQWDRAGRRDEHSSCWIRTMHPWGGAGWGAQFIPRVGMEVVVVFEGGDPDKPMVLGALYNATHPVPFVLPHEKTRSGFRTRSSPGGDGFNELSFEDRKGGEAVQLRAERDLRELVRRDHVTEVLHRQQITVGENQIETVQGSRFEAIQGSLTRSVKGDAATVVRGDSREDVGGSRRTSVGGLDSLSAGALSVVVEQSAFFRIDGSHNVTVGTEEAPGEIASHVNGDQTLGATGKITLRADAGLVLVCGDTRLDLSPEGLKISGKNVSLAASERASFEGKGPALSLGTKAELVADAINLYAKQGSVELDSNARIMGQKVMLNCDPGSPEMAPRDAPKEERHPVQLKLLDHDGEPYAGKKYHLVVAGVMYDGTTGGDGLVDEQVPKSAKTGRLTLWPEDYPTGRRLEWTLDIGDLEDAHTPRGAQERLRNLGYLHRPPTDELDEVARAALRLFQIAEGLDPTGELDGPTVSALSSSHGH